MSSDTRTRARVKKFVEEHPGTYPAQVARELEHHHSVVIYHLRKLEDEDVLIAKPRRPGSSRRIYLTPFHDSHPASEFLGVLDSERRWTLMTLLWNIQPDSTTVAELATSIGWPERTTRHHLSILLEAGAVDLEETAESRNRYKASCQPPPWVKALELQDPALDDPR